MKTFFVADWHLGETRFDLIGRPFSDQKEMIERLIWEHNQLVSPGDWVHVIGDVCYQKTPEFINQVSRFNGNKILYRGNHDRVFSDADLEPYFSSILPEGVGAHQTFDTGKMQLECFLTHYPTQGKINKFNLVGHIHAAWKYQLNMLNVGVDVHHFRPVCSDTLEFHFNAIKDFYDEDVWVAYNENNATYLGLRGKKGSYLDTK